MEILDKANEIKEWIVELRRDFHMYPEPSFEEIRTSGIVEQKLKEMDIEVKHIGKTGIVGILRGDKPGKVIGLRADMDALSVYEETGLPFASKKEGFMHACGHDSHISMLLGAAKILSNMRDKISGTVKFIFQPAEEAAGGAKVMIAGGALENPKLDMIYGMHIASAVEVGKVIAQEGQFMASGDEWKLIISGKSCHGSSPWEGHDVMVCTAAVINGLQAIVSRVNDARNPIVINIGTANGGERFNVVPGKMTLTGMNRTFTEYSRKMMPEWMKKVIKSICESYDCTYEFEYKLGFEVTINDDKVTEFVKNSVKKIVGEDNILGAEKGMGSEDFSEYLKLVPGMIMMLGTRNEEKNCVFPQHSNHYLIDEDSLPIGTACYVQVAIDYLVEEN